MKDENGYCDNPWNWMLETLPNTKYVCFPQIKPSQEVHAHTKWFG